MQGHWPFVYFGAMAVVAFGLSCWATRVVLRQPDVPRLQRRWQLALTWVLPIVGALLVVEIYRVARRRTRSGFVTADEINPMLNQALQPLAKDATRAAEGFIEQEIFDATLQHFTDSGGDGGAGHGGSH
jgi:hypothetical protein